MQVHNPDEGLLLTCSAARAATEAYREAAEQDASSDALSALLQREIALISTVTVTRAKTTAGLAAKAAALDHFVQATSASEPSPVAVALAITLIEDGLGVVRGMIGDSGSPHTRG